MKKKIVIIGGGFAGSYAAKKLEDSFDVCLIDKKGFFEFTPSVLKAIVSPNQTKGLHVPHKSYLDKAKIVTETVDYVNKNSVKTDKKSYPYDYLIICSGSHYTRPIKNKDLFLANRAKELEKHYTKLKKSSNVLIIGGGIVGVELAAEICGKYSEKKITLVHSKNRLVNKNSIKSSKYVTAHLSNKGVKIILNEKVISGRGGVYKTNKGRRVKVGLAFACTGIKPNSKFMKKEFLKDLDKNEFIKVNNFLEVSGKENIFAIGDVNDFCLEKTAHSAERQAKQVIKNILLREKGHKLTKYYSERAPLIISLGRYKGVLEKGNFVLTGFIPAFIKSLIEKYIIFNHKII